MMREIGRREWDEQEEASACFKLADEKRAVGGQGPEAALTTRNQLRSEI